MSTALQNFLVLLQYAKTQPDTIDKVAGEKYILTVFSNLPDEDKIQILESLLSIQELDKKVPIQDIKVMPSIVPDVKIMNDADKAVDTELPDIDEFNKKELIVLKTFIIKSVIMFLFILVLLMIVFIIAFGSGAIHSTNAFIEELSAIYGYWSGS